MIDEVDQLMKKGKNPKGLETGIEIINGDDVIHEMEKDLDEPITRKAQK